MRCAFPAVFLVGLASLALADATNPKSHWTQWRGPTGQGHSSDTRVPLRWSETENVLWKTPLPGSGNSTPIVFGDRIFLTAATERGKERLILCLNSSDGKIVWQDTVAREVRPERSHDWNGYASPSCVTDGKHVWSFFGTPGVFCHTMDGKLVWKHSFGTFVSQAGWGTAASPFLHDDLLIVNCDNDSGPGAAPAALVAIDKTTGKVRWSTPRDQGRGFSTPRLMQVAGGRTDLVLNGPAGLWGYDPATGKERWQCRRSAAKEQHKFGEPMPVDDGSRIFIASGRPGPYQILELPGEGDITTSHVKYKGVRTGHRDVSTAIVWQGRAYAADSKGAINCYDLKTGKELFAGLIGNKRNRSLASPISLQGRLLWLLDDGTTVVVKPGDRLDIVARNKLDGESLSYGASPAVADGRLFLRSQTHLYCIANTK